MTPTPPAPSPAATWLGAWSLPPDRPAQVMLAVALALLVLALVPHGPRWLASTVDLAHVNDRSRKRRFLTIAAFFAAFASLGYIAYYLRGGPRAPEAASYWLEGRALSHGLLSWPIAEPTASFRARDLLLRAPDRLSGVLPPGYPLLLAMGFLVGAPMLVGPVLAAAIVAATWLLAHEVAAAAMPAQGKLDPPTADEAWGRAEGVARLATGLSIVSAALRYHTADARPEGAAAFAATLTLACSLRAMRTGGARLFGAAGLALGLLAASSPPSALAIGVVVVLLAAGAFRSRIEQGGAAGSSPGDAAGGSGTGPVACLLWALVGVLPGALLLLAARRASTGHALSSPGAAYLALAHVGAAPWSATALVRGFRAHLLDIANLEPMALLMAVPLFRRREREGVLPIAIVLVAQVLVVSMWRPGVGEAASTGDGAASTLVTVLPIEHVLIALGVAHLFPRSMAPASLGTLALSLAGFAFHASRAHEAIAVAGIGRPRFEPDVARESNVTHGLLFFDDDEGFELSYDPSASASHAVVAARLRGDDHDRLLYDLLGRPSAHRYVATATSASIVSWAPFNAGSETWRFEAEGDWPPVSQSGGWAEAIAGGNNCASDGRVVRVSPEAKAEAKIVLPLPVPSGAAPSEARVWVITPRVLQHGDGGAGSLAVVAEPDLPPLAEWTWDDTSRPATCLELPGRPVELGGKRPHAWLVIKARGGPVMLDRTTLRPR